VQDEVAGNANVAPHFAHVLRWMALPDCLGVGTSFTMDRNAGDHL